MNATAVLFPSLAEPKAKETQGAKERNSGVVRGSDGRVRPAWVGKDPLLEDYYDNEWGRVVTDGKDLFELQSLLVFQAGLRWKSVLLRRPRLRAACQGFSVGYLSLLEEEDIDRLMQDDRMIRNRQKIAAVVGNAKAVRNLEGYPGGLAELVWSFQPERTPCPVYVEDIPASIPESVALAKELKSRGFSFVGPKNCFALMQAAGVVDTNPLDSENRGLTGLWDKQGNRVGRPKIPGTSDTNTHDVR
mgnify:FL=1